MRLACHLCVTCVRLWGLADAGHPHAPPCPRDMACPSAGGCHPCATHTRGWGCPPPPPPPPSPSPPAYPNEGGTWDGYPMSLPPGPPANAPAKVRQNAGRASTHSSPTGTSIPTGDHALVIQRPPQQLWSEKRPSHGVSKLRHKRGGHRNGAGSAERAPPAELGHPINTHKAGVPNGSLSPSEWSLVAFGGVCPARSFCAKHPGLYTQSYPPPPPPTPANKIQPQPLPGRAHGIRPSGWTIFAQQM